MKTSQQSLDRFLAAMDEAINTDYLFFRSRVPAVIDEITTSHLLFDLTNFCCKADDKESLYARYLRKNPFVAPPRRQFIALGFYLFSDILNNTDTLSDIIMSCFPGYMVVDNYKNFISGFVVPYRDAVRDVAEYLIFAKKAKENRESSYSKDNVDEKYLMGLTDFLTDDTNILQNAINSITENEGWENDKRLRTTVKILRDAMAAAKSFAVSATKGEIERFNSLYIAYKYSMTAASRSKAKVSGHVADVEELLIDHGIIVAD